MFPYHARAARLNRAALLLGTLLALVSCATEPAHRAASPPARSTPAASATGLTLTPVGFGDLSGWSQDNTADALASFLQSCRAWTRKSPTDPVDAHALGGPAGAWQDACAAARDVPTGDDAAAQTFFAQDFQPYAVTGTSGTQGLFTGYYAPEIPGSLQAQGDFQTPLYARPDDLISVDLGLFKDKLKGQHIVGKVQGRDLVLYDERAAIASGSLNGRATPLAYVRDPVAAFFMEVQGSGHIRLPDGGTLSLGYDGANGRSYVAIGRIMAARGDIAKPVTMPAIRAWMESHPDQAQDVMNQNPSYVFFRRLPDSSVVGAQGIPLTAQRSMAVDPHFIPLGAPVWLDSADGEGHHLHRLMIAQDTGGAIKGTVRGDFYWGEGDDAARQAGAMQSAGRYYVLLPKSVTPPTASADTDQD